MRKDIRREGLAGTWDRRIVGTGIVRAVAGAVLLVLLGACAHGAPTAAMRTGDRAMRNEVRLVRLVQAVGGDETGLPRDERRRVTAFLDRIGFGYGDEAALLAGRDYPAAARADLARLLRAFGARLAGDAPELAEMPAPDHALLVVERHLVIPPRCPDRRLDAGRNHGNAPSPQFGCADLINLGQMVADPEHLLAGAPAAPNDPEKAAAAIRAWRASPPVILVPSGTSEAGGAGSASGSGGAGGG